MTQARPTTIVLLLTALAAGTSARATEVPACPLHAAHRAANATTGATSGADSAAAAPSAYTSRASSDLPALTSEQVADYLDGKGMGLAIPAEVHGYPGPLHVLELADEMALDEPQRRQLEGVYDRMHQRATELGTRIIDAERRLDQLFRAGEATTASLRPVLEEIGRLQADLRFTHLAAHLESRAMLTPAQVASYASLRGYAEPKAPPGAAPAHPHGR